VAWPPNDRGLDQLETLPRLNAVIQEVLRLVPPVGGLFRRAKAPVRLGPWTIAAGRVIQVDLRSTLRDSTGGADGDRFRPERHLEAATHTANLPFGVAPRVCLGKPLAELELRLLLTRLLQTLRFTLEPGQDLTLEVIPTPRPRSGLQVRVERR
jgi:cytochrome P450